ncbi:MAG: hypothetical protein KC457_05150, partial [Myxococcales bacterium]|nr:hypothetical protein [Myxococcales bacterium]
MTNDKKNPDILPLLDDLGPTSISVASRRIDALATALDGHQVDLLASDARDLTQLAALRRLGPNAAVLLGVKSPHQSTDHPLTGILEALGQDSSLTAEDLAKATATACGPEHGGVAMRSSSATRLLEDLDAFAQEGEARNIAGALPRGGDLSQLIRALERSSGSKATKIAASAGAVVIAAPVDNDDLGVSLDDPGLQLGATSPWSLLLEDTEAETLRSTLEDLQTSSRTSEQRPTTRAAHVIEYTGPRDITTDPAQDLLDFLQRELDGCDARHVALVVRGTWTPESSGSVSFASGSPLPVVELARELGQALDRRGHGPLALLIFDDPKLLRVENAYELRDVAHVLATGDDTQSIPASETLQGWMNDLIQDCERDAAEALDKPESEPIAPYLQKWRRD